MSTLPSLPNTLCNPSTRTNAATRRLVCLNSAELRWNRIDDDAGAGGIGVFAADPTDPERLYISQNPRGQPPGGAPSMQWSIDGGETWNADPELDRLMTAGGVFKYLTVQGPSTNRGGAGAAFQGYAQPLLLAWSAEDPGVLVAGGVDSGVFLSLDAGANWSLVTDPLTPFASGVDHLSRPRYAYFDTEPANGFAVYIGTQGRGVWRLTFTPPSADAGGPYVVDEGAVAMLSAAASSDDGALNYAWDLDDDGEFDDATGITVPYTTIGQDSATPSIVRVKVTDPDGAYDVADTTVTVRNVAPVLETLGTDGPVDESSLVTVRGRASDPGWLDVLSATVDWGDETPVEALAGIGEQEQPDASLVFSGTHVYGDDGVFSAEVCVTDDDTTTCETTDVIVGNVDPIVTIDETDVRPINGIPTFVSSLGQPLDVPASASDPGSDDLAFTWQWDDTSPDDVQLSLVNPPDPDPFPSPSFQPRDVELTAVHAYVAAGQYEVGVTLADDDAGFGFDTADVIILGDSDRSRGAGYWRHQYRQKGSVDFDAATLLSYADIVGHLSTVFDEVDDASTFARAEAVLNPAGGNGNALRTFDRQLLAVWLNVANGAIGLDELVDTDRDGVADIPLATAVETAEAMRLDPTASRAAVLTQQDILEAINQRDGS